MGLRLRWLGTHRLTWRDLAVIVQQLPIASALGRAVRGAAGIYGPTDYLLAGVINLLRSVSWQLGGDAKAPKPERFLLPGMDDDDKLPTLRGDLMPIDELRKRLGWDDEGR